jgi:sarcosine oxidase subunit beta
MMRQWTGLVSETPDHAPIIGPAPQIKGFILSVGWGGYGFMGGPGSGKALSEYIIGGETPQVIQPFKLERFETGEMLHEPAIITKQER